MRRTSARKKVVQSKSNHSSKGDTNAEGETLKVLLQSLTGSELKKRLSKAPKRLSAEELHILLHMLQKLDVTVGARNVPSSDTELHCVRCHKAYLESDNGIRACHILHGDLDPEESPGGDWLWSCEACGGKPFGQDESVEDFHTCFRGRHTTDVREANRKYHPESCEDNECFEEPDSDWAEYADLIATALQRKR